MKVDSTTVRLVLAIAEEGSISRAADRLGLAVAAAAMRRDAIPKGDRTDLPANALRECHTLLDPLDVGS